MCPLQRNKTWSPYSGYSLYAKLISSPQFYKLQEDTVTAGAFVSFLILFAVKTEAGDKTNTTNYKHIESEINGRISGASSVGLCKHE